jgi:hypothetical protein
MPDSIGRITVPTVINSGQTFPLTTQYPFGFAVERPEIGDQTRSAFNRSFTSRSFGLRHVPPSHS